MTILRAVPDRMWKLQFEKETLMICSNRVVSEKEMELHAAFQELSVTLTVTVACIFQGVLWSRLKALKIEEELTKALVNTLVWAPNPDLQKALDMLFESVMAT